MKKMWSLLCSRQLVLNSFRSYAFKSDLKIKWNRPEKVSCILPEKSGDGPLQEIDKKQIVPIFQECKHLTNDHDLLFSLENNRRFHTTELYKEMYIKSVQRHNLDYGSVEAKIAEMTAIIRRRQELMVENPRNKRLKVKVKELIDKRKKFLKYLRRWDYKRFEWILEKLDLIYKPSPPEFHWITRKESLVKLTDQYCKDIKIERLNKYKNSLESQQIDFLEKKLKNLEFIRNEQQECLIPVTVSQEQIQNVKEKLENLKLKHEKLIDNN